MKSSRRYQPPRGAEAGYEPGSRGRVLRNKLGIRSKKEIDRLEIASLIEAQTYYVHAITPNTRFTAELLRRMPRDWLGEIYECTPCKPGPLRDVAQRIAMVHSELLFIHPFRDGNGRLARWVAGLMALQAGFPTPQYRFTGRGSRHEYTRYMQAVRGAYGFDRDEPSDLEPLIEFFEEAIVRRAGGI